MSAPELVEARQKLDRVPVEWMNDALETSVLQRAKLAALRRELADRVVTAGEQRSAAAEAVMAGDPGAVDDVVWAQVLLQAAEKARDAIVVPDLDRDAVVAALEVADRALSDSDRALELPVLDYAAEVDLWRRICAAWRQVFDPPEQTDADRSAAVKLAPVAAEVERALADHATWRDAVARSGGEPLGLLASAAAKLEQRRGLAGRVAEVAGVVRRANENRARQGLTWHHPLPFEVVA